AIPRDIADPKDVLRMIEKPLRVVGMTPQRFGGAGKRLLVAIQGAVQVSPTLGDLADECECSRSLGERIIGQAALVLVLVISQHSGTDAVESVEAADRLQLVLEVAEHEADQPLGFSALVACCVAGLDRGYCERAGHRHSGERRRRKHSEPAIAPRRFPLNQLVETDAEHPCDELQEGKALAIASLAEIRRERLGALRRAVPAPVVFEAKRWREAFLFLTSRHVAGEGFA